MISDKFLGLVLKRKDEETVRNSLPFIPAFSNHKVTFLMSGEVLTTDHRR